MISFLSFQPSAGTPDGVVRVTWEIGDDLGNFTPNRNDEIRLMTSSGALVARTFLRDATPAKRKYLMSAEAIEQAPEPTSLICGYCDLMCPPYTGGFLLALVEGSTFRRIISTPFRVAGPPFTPQKTLHIGAVELTGVPCHGRMDVTFAAEDISPTSVVVLCKADAMGNNGYATLGEGPFAHCEAVYSLPLDFMETNKVSLPSLGDYPQVQLSMIAPSRPGEYQVRCMETPKCGIPYTKYVSSVFTVHPSKLAPNEVVIAGSMTTSVSECFVGETIEVNFEFTSECGSLLSELDSIVLYPYGRSEAVNHDSGLWNCVGQKLFKGTLRLPAPFVDGFYDVSYYSYTDQRPILTSKPVTVKPPVASLSHLNLKPPNIVTKKGEGRSVDGEVRSCVDGNVTLRYAISRDIFSQRDRVVVYDDLANVVESVFVEASSTEANENLQKEGTVQLKLFLPGKYMVRYYSDLLRRTVCQLEGYIYVEPSVANRLPKAQLVALEKLPLGHDIHVAFEQQAAIGGDGARKEQERFLDCIALFKETSRDMYLTHTRDGDADALRAISVHYLRGVTKLEHVFECPKEVGRYSIRYLVAVNGYFLRICTTEVTFSVLEPTAPELQYFYFQSLALVSLNDLAKVKHRTTWLEADVDKVAEKFGFLQGEKARKSEMVPSTAPVLGTSKVKHRFTSILHWTLDDTEYKGAVLPPKACSNADQVIVTYHILEGLPRGEDKIVLISDDLTKILAECKIEFAQGSLDLRIGTLALSPPMPGQYYAGYFSEKYRSFVLMSPLFRVTDGSAEIKRKEKSMSDNNNYKAAAPQSGMPLTIQTSSRLQLESTLSLVPQGRRTARVRCLIVAVMYMKKHYELKGSVNDATRFRKVTQQAFNIANENIVTLDEVQTDPHLQPTAENIREHLEWLVEGAQPNDQLLFYFSGSGSRICDLRTGEEDNCLLPADFDWSQRMMSYKELRQRLYEAVPEGTHVHGIIDACFSSNKLDITSQYGIWRDEGESMIHRGVAAIWRRREREQIAPRTPWRCVATPPGIFNRFCTVSTTQQGELGGMQGFLVQPYTAQANSVESREKHSACCLLYDASRCSWFDLQGAWDVFLPEVGSSVGLFTHAFCSVLETEMRTQRLDETFLWAELHEKVCQQMRNSPYRSQLPRLLVQSIATLGNKVVCTMQDL